MPFAREGTKSHLKGLVGSLVSAGAFPGAGAWSWLTASQRGCGCSGELAKCLYSCCHQLNLLDSKEAPKGAPQTDKMPFT